MIEWLKQQYNNLIFELFPILPSYLVRDCYKEFDEKYWELQNENQSKKFKRGVARMTEKRFTRHKSLDGDCTIYDELKDFQFPSLPLGVSEIFCDKLNELHDEKELLEMNNKDLVSFIKSKGYTLKDFLKYVGQFKSVGVNKEDWND